MWCRTCRRATSGSWAAASCWSSCTSGCSGPRWPRCCRWRRCTGWVGSARPSWCWSSPTATAATTTSSGGSPPSNPAPPPPRSPRWPPGWGSRPRRTRTRWSRCCSTGCASRHRWLLIYDNAEQPAQPARACSRRRAPAACWSPPDGRPGGNTPNPLPVDVLPRGESVQLLAERTGHTDQTSLERVGASWPSWSGTSPWPWTKWPPTWNKPTSDSRTYHELLRGRARGAVRAGPGPGAGRRVRAERRISGGWPPCGRCRWTGSATTTPAAEALLELCAYLGPDIPRALPTTHPELLPAAAGRGGGRSAGLQPGPGRAGPLLAGRAGPRHDRRAPAGAGRDPGPTHPRPGSRGRRGRGRAAARGVPERQLGNHDLAGLCAAAAAPAGRVRARPTAAGGRGAGRLAAGPGLDLPAGAGPVPAGPTAGRTGPRPHRGRARPRPRRGGLATRRTRPRAAGPGRPDRRPHPTTNGPCRSARPPSAPTTPTSAPGATTSASCCRTWAT